MFLPRNIYTLHESLLGWTAAIGGAAPSSRLMWPQKKVSPTETN
jgi:hypothetical protein